MFFMMLVTMTVGLLHTTMDNLGVRASTQKALKNVAAGRLIGNILGIFMQDNLSSHKLFGWQPTCFSEQNHMNAPILHAVLKLQFQHHKRSDGMSL